MSTLRIPKKTQKRYHTKLIHGTRTSLSLIFGILCFYYMIRLCLNGLSMSFCGIVSVLIYPIPYKRKQLYYKKACKWCNHARRKMRLWFNLSMTYIHYGVALPAIVKKRIEETINGESEHWQE